MQHKIIIIFKYELKIPHILSNGTYLSKYSMKYLSAFNQILHTYF